MVRKCLKCLFKNKKSIYFCFRYQFFTDKILIISSSMNFTVLRIRYFGLVEATGVIKIRIITGLDT